MKAWTEVYDFTSVSLSLLFPVVISQSQSSCLSLTRGLYLHTVAELSLYVTTQHHVMNKSGYAHQ